MTRSTGVPASARVKLLVKLWNITTSLNPSGGALEGIEGASWGVVVQLRVLKALTAAAPPPRVAIGFRAGFISDHLTL